MEYIEIIKPTNPNFLITSWDILVLRCADWHHLQRCCLPPGPDPPLCLRLHHWTWLWWSCGAIHVLNPRRPKQSIHSSLPRWLSRPQDCHYQKTSFVLHWMAQVGSLSDLASAVASDATAKMTAKARLLHCHLPHGHGWPETWWVRSTPSSHFRGDVAQKNLMLRLWLLFPPLFSQQRWQ